ncbi:MAG: acyltransferase [Gammaproteobacteria bacterium]|nr:acyltransferase [Gammaproteobacteria bacterium]
MMVASEAETNRMPTIASLDGIRALAVMLVFVAHAGFSHIVPGGFGVTIFFFLSGYLITTLMRVEQESTGRIRYKNFYLRRIYRIFPPLYVVLIITICYASISSSAHQIRTGECSHPISYDKLLLGFC